MTAVALNEPVAHQAGGGLMRRLNIVTALIGGVTFGTVGWLIAHLLLQDGDHGSDQVVVIMLCSWAVGFMVGIGAFNGPINWLLGRDQTHEDELFLAGKDQGIGRYFRFTTDHKVVGIQYLIVTMVLFAVGGTLAMLIRTNLISPHSNFLSAQTYNALVGLHGLIMIIATIIMITGPFGNFIMPIMIGARDMAFPRLNALSLWLIVAAIPVLLSAAFLGGIPTGWVGYAPLANQAPPGMDSYSVTIIIFAISSAIAGANITTTVLTMRARGMSWNRTPIFVYGTIASVGLAIPAFPMFMASQVLLQVDRTQGGNFFVASGGGSPWLYSNLFWLMGHPEVYVILIPALAALMEITPVFARKPLFSFNAAVISIAGIVGLSVMVWAHHMYAAGWAPDLNGPFMLTTEMISVPTGLLFLVILGTLWRGRVWTTLPMMATYAMLWNFIIGGVTGIYLSDVPADYALHGSMFVTAHFHYTLMGAGLTGAIGALSYWFPKMTGRMLARGPALISFWLVQIGFNVTFMGMFAVGLAGQPRRVVTYAHLFATGNFVSTIGAYTIGIGMLFLLYGVISSWRGGEIAPANPWGAKTLEWTVPNPIPLENFLVMPVVTADAYGYGEPELPPVEPAVDPDRVPAHAGLAAEESL
ncbi:MAG: cbb3-type cytochrome c oxidase subunit I [Jatrophihabitantaceae bacterium]